ncbi:MULTISPECIES: prealbumin-like fold domain-containing protein [Streptomyces]
MRSVRRSSVAGWGGSAVCALAALAVLLGVSGETGGQAAAAAAAAAPAAKPLSVTFVARSCPQYSDVMANKARNNVQESLRDLGPDSNYAYSDAVSAAKEASGTPLPPCEPLPGWTFSTGPGIAAKSPSTLNLSTVTSPIRQNITTKASTAELDAQGNATGRQLQGAVTVPLTDEEIKLSPWLVAQGGTKAQPLNGMQEQYGFGALRCAQDAVNGDNVEYVAFPSGARHVFCYYYAITPPPDAGTIKVVKKVQSDTAGEGSFRFDGNLSYGDTNDDGTNDFVLNASAQKQDSETFVRAAGSTPWTFKEAAQPGSGWQPPAAPRCTVVAADGGEGTSQVTVDSTGASSVVLAAGDTVTCTYTNTRSSGKALLEKESIGGTGTFDIDLTPPSGVPPLRVSPVTTTRQGVPVTVAEAPAGAAPGTYTIDETIPAPDGTGAWELTGVNCDGTDVPITRGPATDSAPRGTWRASYEVKSVDDARCLLTDKFTPGGAINIDKTTRGGTGTFAYGITPHPAGGRIRTSATTDRATATTVTAGVAAIAHPEGSTSGPAADELTVDDRVRYTVQEFLPPPTADGHWELVDADCGAAGSDVDKADATVQVRLTAKNPRPTCHFINRFVPVATLDVTKRTTGDTELRPGPARLTLTCSDGTADSLRVDAGETSGKLQRHTFTDDVTCVLRETASGAGDDVEVHTTAELTVAGKSPTPLALGQEFTVRSGQAVTVGVANILRATIPTSPPPTSPPPTPTPTPTPTPSDSPTPTPTSATSHPDPSDGPSPGPSDPGHLAETGTSTAPLWAAGAAALALAIGTLVVTALRRRRA